MRLYRDAQQMLQVCAKELGITEERLASEIIKKALTAYTRVEQTSVTNPNGLKARYRQAEATKEPARSKAVKAPF